MHVLIVHVCKQMRGSLVETSTETPCRYKLHEVTWSKLLCSVSARSWSREICHSSASCDCRIIDDTSRDLPLNASDKRFRPSAPCSVISLSSGSVSSLMLTSSTSVNGMPSTCTDQFDHSINTSQFCGATRQQLIMPSTCAEAHHQCMTTRSRLNHCIWHHMLQSRHAEDGITQQHYELQHIANCLRGAVCFRGASVFPELPHEVGEGTCPIRDRAVRFVDVTGELCEAQ